MTKFSSWISAVVKGEFSSGRFSRCAQWRCAMNRGVSHDCSTLCTSKIHLTTCYPSLVHFSQAPAKAAGSRRVAMKTALFCSRLRSKCKLLQMIWKEVHPLNSSHLIVSKLPPLSKGGGGGITFLLLPRLNSVLTQRYAGWPFNSPPGQKPALRRKTVWV